jgi:hypothetical protein
MTETAPETPAPDEPGGLLGRLRAWAEKDILPRLSAVEADGAKLKGLAPELSSLASIVEKIIEAADPEAAPVIAALASDAGKIAARIKTAVADLGASSL